MYLLDTNIFLWWLKEDSRLSKSAHLIINNPNNQIFVSSVVIWEIAIKSKIGKLRVPDDIVRYVEKSGFVELPINNYHAINTKKIHLHHKDPFDRMLISQAKVEKLIILTHNKIFKKYPASVEIV